MEQQIRHMPREMRRQRKGALADMEEFERPKMERETDVDKRAKKTEKNRRRKQSRRKKKQEAKLPEGEESGSEMYEDSIV